MSYVRCPEQDICVNASYICEENIIFLRNILVTKNLFALHLDEQKTCFPFHSTIVFFFPLQFLIQRDAEHLSTAYIPHWCRIPGQRLGLTPWADSPVSFSGFSYSLSGRMGQCCPGFRGHQELNHWLATGLCRAFSHQQLRGSQIYALSFFPKAGCGRGLVVALSLFSNEMPFNAVNMQYLSGSHGWRTPTWKCTTIVQCMLLGIILIPQTTVRSAFWRRSYNRVESRDSNRISLSSSSYSSRRWWHLAGFWQIKAIFMYLHPKWLGLVFLFKRKL